VYDQGEGDSKREDEQSSIQLSIENCLDRLKPFISV